MKIIFSIFTFLLFLPATGQNKAHHVKKSQGIEEIVFSSDEIYKISVETVPGNDIKFFTQTEGEYFNDINLESEIRDKTLYLNSRYIEILQNGYDKLSAHKVYSMEVKLEIPEGMELTINSNIASVYLTGNYEKVLIQLKTGSCYFDDFEGNAVVNTYDGNIFGNARSLNPEASSRNGEVNVPQNSYGIHKMVLTSINGHIKLSETK